MRIFLAGTQSQRLLNGPGFLTFPGLKVGVIWVYFEEIILAIAIRIRRIGSMSGEAHTARGLLADAICRMTKTLEFLDIVCNCTGFFFLLVKAFLQGEIESFSETII